MINLACFLEEQSAKAFLEGVLPRILPDNVATQYVVFEGKRDLEKQLVRKLRNWQKPNTVFLVMRDQDASDCKLIKNKLVELTRRANQSDTLVRVACHELEGFYFGDLDAVEKALRLRIPSKNSARYRVPDNVVTPSRELGKITKGSYQKIGGSREIGKIISLDGNSSHSFNALLSGIKKLVNCDT